MKFPCSRCTSKNQVCEMRKSHRAYSTRPRRTSNEEIGDVVNHGIETIEEPASASATSESGAFSGFQLPSPQSSYANTPASTSCVGTTVMPAPIQVPSVTPVDSMPLSGISFAGDPMSVWPSDPILDFPIWSEFDSTVLRDDCNTWTFPSAWNETAEPNPDEEKLLEYVDSSQAAPVCPAMGQRDSVDQTHSPGSNDATTTVERNGMRMTPLIHGANSKSASRLSTQLWQRATQEVSEQV